MNNSITNHSAGSRYSTMSMVQVAIFGAIICIMAFTPLSGLYPAWIYESNDYPYSGDYRFTAYGTEKRRSTRLSFRSHKFYQQHDKSYGDILCYLLRFTVSGSSAAALAA